MKITKEERDVIENRILPILPLLDERQRRLFLANEAKALGYGGVTAIHEITGISRVTLTEGIKQLRDVTSNGLEVGRSRVKGAGRKNVSEKQSGLVTKLIEILEANTKGDPMSALIWTSKSLRNIQKELISLGYNVSHLTLAKLIREEGYSLQANRKDLAIQRHHPERDEQFRFINRQCKLFFACGNPVISIDSKKKEKVGNFKNDGVEYNKKGEAIQVLDHDFPIKELGKATPYGVYDIFRNEGFVSVGVSGDTAEFAVETIRKWWRMVGEYKYPRSSELLVTADCGGSNGYRVRLWKASIQVLANELGMNITVVHFPPGTSKWNKIEHRLFSFISKNWRGRPLLTLAVIVNLIKATNTNEGLKVECVLDENEYKRKIEVSDKEFNAINIKPHYFHGEWNYTIRPQKEPYIIN